MNTALECMPCFMKMALNEARLAAPGDDAKHHEIVMAWAKRLIELDLSVPPPDIARHLADLVRELTGCGDLYEDDKRQANARVRELLPELTEMIEIERAKPGGDPLALVLELAIIGNYIDRGVEVHVDWEAELSNVSCSIDEAVLASFKRLAIPGASVLMLGDNTGEIVLDTLLVEELNRLGCDVTYAVRSKPVINDATLADAQAVGMTRLCRVVESGVDTPGTVLSRCTPDFLDRMRGADVILSKGQGNFESLEGVWPGIFCAFKVKCGRVARDSGLPYGCSAFVLTSLDSAGDKQPC